MLSVVAAQLNDIRDDAALEFQNIFTKCQAMAASADTTITVPKTLSQRTLSDNVEHENAEQYYRRTVFTPFLDYLVQQLSDRFQGRTKDAIKCITSSQVFLVMFTTKWSISDATMAATFQMKMD